VSGPEKFQCLLPVAEEKHRSRLSLILCHEKGRWIPDEVIAVSKGAAGNRTIENIMADGRDNDALHLLAVNLGSYVAELQFKELYRNLIAIQKTTHWEFILCDLDEIRSVSERRFSKHKSTLKNCARK